jgi:hypothetical protein
MKQIQQNKTQMLFDAWNLKEQCQAVPQQVGTEWASLHSSSNPHTTTDHHADDHLSTGGTGSSLETLLDTTFTVMHAPYTFLHH